MEEDGERAVDKVNISIASIVQYLLAIYHKVPHVQCKHSEYLLEAVQTQANLELESSRFNMDKSTTGYLYHQTGCVAAKDVRSSDKPQVHKGVRMKEATDVEIDPLSC
ncbi:hypothetical protein A4A49_53174 [Nicotiana attenuata]|uniref:Uncharacterized protein n=1 Tax=Nicotiana attenuata TaxID=49451 RepID=A0A1J6JAD8_NICAT|nr:hypothetical protein A4A49_53174 [Nicotiana attenuata]